MEKLLERRFKIPFGARKAAKQIQAKRIVLGKSMAGDVRFREQAKAGDSAGPGKLMPLRSADRTQLHAANHAMEKRFDGTQVAQRQESAMPLLAAEGLDDPTRSIPLICASPLSLRLPAFRAEFAAAWDGLAALTAEFCAG